MHRTQTCLCVLSLALCLIPSPIRAADNTAIKIAPLDGPAAVGLLGDPANLVFKGDTPFADDNLRWAISADLQTQLAAEPTAPLQDYLKTLDRRLRAGFRRAGYFRPSVDIQPDIASGKILVFLDPGTRYRCGDIKVEGAKTFPVDLLINRLTHPTTQPFFATTLRQDFVRVDNTENEQTATDPLWTIGDPAPFDDVTAAAFPERISLAMAALGYFNPQLEVSVNPAGKVATLNIRMLDEGLKATVDHIDVKGLKRNRPQDVTDYLKVKPGDAMDLDRLMEMQQRLWDSGRFSKHVISITRRRDDPSKVILLVDLEEVDNVPLLIDLLLPVEQVALRVRQWLLNLGDGRDDLLLEYQDNREDVTVTFNAKYGIVSRMHINATTPPVLGDDSDGAIVMTRDVIGIYLPAANLKLVIPNPDVSATTTIAMTRAAESENQHWGFSLGWTMSSDKTAQPLTLNMWLPPAAILDYAHLPNCSYELRDGIFTVTAKTVKMRFDAATGRPLDIQSLTPKDFQIRLQTGGNIAKKQSQDIQTALAAADTYEPNKPVGSFITFTAQALCHSWLFKNSTAEQRTHLAIAVSHILTPDAFKTLDESTHAPTTESSDDAFTLPFLPRDLNKAGFVAMMGRGALPFIDKIFVRGTWPSTLARLTCFALTGHSESLEPELGHLSVSPDTGPLASLVASELLSYASPSLSKYFANRGLRDLSTAVFIKDVQGVFEGNTAGSQFITTVIKNIQNLDEHDLDSLRSTLPPNTAKAVLAGIEELRSQRNYPTDVALTAALGRTWDAGLRTLFETELHRLANPPPATQP
jgi:Surface antigen variable number repeat